MAAPALALKPAKDVMGKAAELVSKALTGDIVRFQGRIYRAVRVGDGRMAQVFLEPIDYDVHVNAISLGLGAVGLAAAGLGAWILWNGISTGGIWSRSKIEILPGFKDTQTAKDAITKRRECGLDQERFGSYLATNNPTSAAQVWDRARANGCRWTYLHRRPS